MPSRHRATLIAMDDEPTTEELRISQLDQETSERERERQAVTGDEAEKHGRRAEKAEYLREKLTQRAEAERKAEERDSGES
jgi:hypothetical protein